MTIAVRPLAESDVETIADAFIALGRPGKDRELYRRYLAEQAGGSRAVLVAERSGRFAGYVCVCWRSDYPPFRDTGVPEIVDLNVLPEHRRHGVATALLDAAEAAVAERSETAGIGCGLTADYGPALLLYLARGYRPDGRGVAYERQTVPPGGTLRLDDEATIMLTRPVEAGAGLAAVDLATFDLALLVEALTDQSAPMEGHRWQIDRKNGQVAFWSVDDEFPEDWQDTGLTPIEPLPSAVWYRDMADFAAGIGDERAAGALARALRGKGAFRRFADELHQRQQHLLPAWAAFRDARAAHRAVDWLVDCGLVDPAAARRYQAAHPVPPPG